MRAHSWRPAGSDGTWKLVWMGGSGPLLTRSSAPLAMPTVTQYSVTPETATQRKGWLVSMWAWLAGVMNAGEVLPPAGATGAATSAGDVGMTAVGESGAA